MPDQPIPLLPRAQSRDHAALAMAVRETRARCGISQEELGRRSTLHRNYVGALERGEINPTFRTMLRLADGLGEALSALIVLYERNVGEGATA